MNRKMSSSPPYHSYSLEIRRGCEIKNQISVARGHSSHSLAPVLLSYFSKVETNTILSGPGVLAAVAVLCLADLPDSHNYEKSFMHRDVVTFSAVKFWYVKISNYNVQL